MDFTKRCHIAKSDNSDSQLSMLFSSTLCNWPIPPAELKLVLCTEGKV